MAIDAKGNWVGQGLGDIGPTVTKIQHKLIYAFPKNSKSVELEVKESGVFDLATQQALANLQPHFTPPLSGTGIANYATQVALGVVLPPPPRKRFWQQGVAYPAMGFLQPDPNVSYNESRAAGSAELLRLALPDSRPKVVIGYSQGDDVVAYFLDAWPINRRGEIKLVVGFGSPSRPAGLTLLGNDPGGQGISNHFTPDWARDRTYHFTHNGDWYPNARGLMPTLYDILTRMELSLDFCLYLFQRLISAVGPLLLGTIGSTLPGAGALANIASLVTTGPSNTVGGSILQPMALFALLPQILWLLIDALKFVFTNAHMHYFDQPESFWRGLTAVDCAAQIIREQVNEVEQVVVYTVPGTWAGWNDGPPAFVAWQLP